MFFSVQICVSQAEQGHRDASADFKNKLLSYLVKVAKLTEKNQITSARLTEAENRAKQAEERSKEAEKKEKELRESGVVGAQETFVSQPTDNAFAVVGQMPGSPRSPYAAVLSGHDIESGFGNVTESWRVRDAVDVYVVCDGLFTVASADGNARLLPYEPLHLAPSYDVVVADFITQKK